MDLKIPKEFKIFGRTYIIEQPERVDKDGNLGECNSHTNIIKVKKGLKQDLKELTYLHELTHAILDSLEYTELSKDETFVERFSKALHQALITSEYEKGK